MNINIATVLACTAAAASAQAPVPVRSVSAPSATTAEPLKFFSEVREIAGGKVLVNAGRDRRLLLFDAALSHPMALADTAGAPVVYPRFGKLISYLGDSTLFVESDSRSLVMIDPNGTFGRVLAPPKLQDFNYLTSGGPTGVDARGWLIYQGQRPVFFPPDCSTADGPKPPPRIMTDSVSLLAADFETRTVDTIGKSKTTVGGISSPQTTYDANCKGVAAKVRVNPAVPSTDAWIVTSTGAVAVVRGHDYHVDWVSSDHSIHAGPKLPFDWRRITDQDKQNRIDSAKRVIDSLTTAGGYREEVCNGGRNVSFNVSGPTVGSLGGGAGGMAPPSIGGGGRGGGGDVISVASGAGGGLGDPGAGRGPSDCQTITVAAEFVPPSEMADYIPPIREGSLKADREGNVWILPTTTAGAKGGLVYDVVNGKGELAERVQLPADRDIAGFGRGGVLYLSHQLGTSGSALERVKILR